MQVDILMSIFVGIFGLIIGSFLNAVIYRLSKNESVAKGRSYCPHCKHALTWKDLIPVVSFLSLGGKCRYCSKKISWQYPLVEIITAGLFVGIYSYQFSTGYAFALLQFLNWVNMLFLWYVACALVIIFAYDLKHYLIPDKILFPAIIVAFVYRLIISFGESWIFSLHWQFVGYLVAALVASGFFLGIFLISKGAWMGFGDVKLAILLGLLVGWPNILVALFLSFFFGAIIGVILMMLSAYGRSPEGRQKIGFKSEIPFAPFLILGTAVALFWGNELIYWYTHVFIF